MRQNEPPRARYTHLGTLAYKPAPALYKVGTGEDIEKAAKPGMFDLKASLPSATSHPDKTNRELTPPQGKAKYNAWQKVADEALTPEQAQEKYVAKIEEMKGTYGYDENKQPEAVGGQ